MLLSFFLKKMVPFFVTGALAKVSHADYQYFNTSNSGSRDSGFKPRQSRCFLRQETLLHFVSLHPGV